MRAKNRTARKLSPTGRRCTVLDWPRGGHSTWPLRQLRVPARPYAGRINQTHR